MQKAIKKDPTSAVRSYANTIEQMPAGVKNISDTMWRFAQAQRHMSALLHKKPGDKCICGGTYKEVVEEDGDYLKCNHCWRAI